MVTRVATGDWKIIIVSTFPVLEVLYQDVIEEDGPFLLVRKIKALGYVRCTIE